MKDDKKALLAAYRRTLFRAKTPGGILCLRIGRRNRRLDALLKKTGARGAAFITAWNPRSRELPNKENRSRNAKLLARLRRLGSPSYPGAGSSPDGRYSEPSYLALGLARSEAKKLGESFGQNAIGNRSGDQATA